MKFRKALEFLAGSILTYVAVACGNAAISDSPSSDASTIDAILDSAQNPVDEAKAEPATYEVAEENCTTANTAGQVTHSFPGVSMNELAANLTVLYRIKNAPVAMNGHAYSYLRANDGMFVDDGFVTINGCGGYDKVRFILRKSPQ